jgi:hypothetical protein
MDGWISYKYTLTPHISLLRLHPCPSPTPTPFFLHARPLVSSVSNRAMRHENDVDSAKKIETGEKEGFHQLPTDYCSYLFSFLWARD